ncbi:MAG TPA: Ig-like domain-containing protein, partial [Nitrososphaera sp.]|nr:Ig-like domain-containing protein [Nitrososphaera sp.]
MAIRGIDAPEDRNGKRKNNKNRLLLAGLIALALLSLFILLGNPGLWTPDDDNEPQAEATNGDDGAGNSTDSEESAQEPASNATQIDETTMVTNTTSSNGGIDDDDDGGNTSDRDPNGRPDGSGYVIIYGGDDDDSDNNSNDGGGFGSGGGGGGGGHRGDDDGDSNKSGANKSPTAQDVSTSTGEDTPVIIQLAGSDQDGDDIEYSMVSTPLYGSAASLDVVTGSLVYTPASNYNGSDSFIFMVTDSHGAYDTAVVSITIIPADDAPIVSNSTSATTDEDQPVNIDLSQSVFDPDGLDTMISILNLTQPQNGMTIL